MQQLVIAALIFRLAALDVSGTWQFSVNWDKFDPGMPVFVLKQKGTLITGTYRGAMGNFNVNGKIEGTRIELDVELTPQFKAQRPEIGRIHFAGTVAATGRSISGTAETQYIHGKFTGTRQQ